MRNLLLAFAALAVAAPLAAQAPSKDAADASKATPLPEGWMMRLDRADADMAGVKFVTMGDGYHATMGPSAIFYDPSNTASGAYTVRAAFTQTRAPRHPEAYGLFFGGTNLQAENQDYMYFLVRQDGRYLIKHRAGAETHTIIDWTEHEAVKVPDDAGRATNALAVEVDAQGARFLVNGSEVIKLDRVPMMRTDGIAGLRVNHNLDVHIGGFAIEPAAR